MDISQTARGEALRANLLEFMDDHVYPAEAVYTQQLIESGNPHGFPPVMEDLQKIARERGLWNLFLPDPEWGAGLSNVEYAPLAEILGRSPIASEACNCSAPDTGNMEVLAQFGTDAQKAAWLTPLLQGEIRSGFAMTEPDVASSDATNLEFRIERDGDEYVLNGRKWWTTNALHPHLRLLIVLGKTDPAASRHRQQSMVLVPIDTPGVEVVRSLPVLGFYEAEGHGVIEFRDVRVPRSNLVAEEGDGFMIGQARLGPGRIHHCMRAIGVGERALELMCRRALSRSTFGQPIATRANVQDDIADARVQLEMLRLLVMKAAWLMDTVGNSKARMEISAIKVAVPQGVLSIIDRSIQIHGGAGLSDDYPLAWMYQYIRALRIADGPDEVHRMTLARQELRKYKVDDASAPAVTPAQA